MASFIHLTPLVKHTICINVIIYSFVFGEQIGNSVSLIPVSLMLIKIVLKDSVPNSKNKSVPTLKKKSTSYAV
jgi:hypothetical protein